MAGRTTTPSSLGGRWSVTLRLLGAVAAALLLADLSLSLPRPAAATPPSSGIVDVLYRYSGGTWNRTLVYYDPSDTSGSESNASCDSYTWTITRTLLRAPYSNLTSQTAVTGGPHTWYDTGFSTATRYRYTLRNVTDWTCVKNSVTTMGTTTTNTPSDWQVEEVEASDAQVVDSRLDLRYSTTVYKDFPFADPSYRGGLFAGFANDASRVSRSYLKFTLPTAPSGSNGRHVSTLSAWFTRNFAVGSVDVQARRCDNQTWTESTLAWSTAPGFQSSATDTQTVDWDPDNSFPGLQWVRWMIHDDVEHHYGASTATLTEVLRTSSETTSAWAYFARRQYESGHEPRLLLCFSF